MTDTVRCLLLAFVSAFHHRAEAVPSVDWNRVISAYTTADVNCKQVTDFSSPLSRSAGDYWCEQAFRTLDLFQLNHCSGWRHPGCRFVKVGQPYQCTCMISSCNELSITSDVVIAIHDCAPALKTLGQNSKRIQDPTPNFQQTGSGYDVDAEIAEFWRIYDYPGRQAGGSSVQSSGEAGNSGGAVGGPGSSSGVNDVGTAGASSNMHTSGAQRHPRSTYPPFSLRAKRGARAGQAASVPMPHSCNQCDGKFRSQRALYEHKRTQHTVADDTYCYLCTIPFKYKRGFMDHLRRKHPEVAADEKERQNMPLSEVEAYMPFACTVCRKRYGSQHGLEDHMKSHTTDETTCPCCNRVYSTKAILKYHFINSHREFPLPESLGGPLIIESEGPFECDKCDKWYATRKGLLAHLKSHGSLDTYCIVCDRTYATKQSYTTHMQNTHPKVAQAEKAVVMEQLEKKRPVKCDLCKKGFKNGESLREHMKFHEGKTNCDICGAKFQRVSSIYLHKKKEHPPQPK